LSLAFCIFCCFWIFVFSARRLLQPPDFETQCLLYQLIACHSNDTCDLEQGNVFKLYDVGIKRSFGPGINLL